MLFHCTSPDFFFFILIQYKVNLNLTSTKFIFHKKYDRDVLVVCDEPEKENSINQLSEYFETIWNQEDSGYFHNNKKFVTKIYTAEREER